MIVNAGWELSWFLIALKKFSKMKENIIQNKTFAFAVQIVKRYQHLIHEKKEYVLSKQFLKSGTSIGANVEEAIGAQSKAEFLSKLSTAYKEARETNYWIRLLAATDYLTEDEKNGLLDEVIEIQKIIAKIRISTKANS